MKNIKKFLNKNLYIFLQTYYGINYKNAVFICNKLGFNPNSKVINFKSLELRQLEYYIEHNFIVNNDLRNVVKENILSLIKLKSYKGRRHLSGLPVNGQRTKSNSKTRKKLSIYAHKIKINNTRRSTKKNNK